ncbi:hypothetical protein AXG93_1587s1160 [Marchantia polymorpha subsp. ruderalis]|uniref:Uncharacterized protein n=1 Tax=Marchantia polymorpha subsp. ruderalis TaxID=1480154 RepID=A0A176WQT1_MARPO|nr:hypothetical protein AXG93_1587s1160 [Marchantia polymorpha subsp. ruderalis]
MSGGWGQGRPLQLSHLASVLGPSLAGALEAAPLGPTCGLTFATPARHSGVRSSDGWEWRCHGGQRAEE